MTINRSYPVTLYVPDPLTAEIQFGGMTVPLSARTNDELMGEARRVIAEQVDQLGGAALPVTIFDNSEDEPFLDFRLCTADEKMPADVGVSQADKKAAHERFAKWQRDLRRAGQRRVQLVPAAQASDREPEGAVIYDEGVPQVARLSMQASRPDDVRPTPVPEAPPEGVFTRELLERATLPEAEQEPVDPFGMDTLMKYGETSEDAAMGWRGIMNRFGLHLPPDADEEAWRAAYETLSVPWDEMKKVAMINERGGAGKTILAAMTAAAFHHANSWPVAGFDNNESGGNWHKRAGLNTGHQLTSKDFAEFYVNNGGVVKRGDLARFGHQHPRDHYTLFTAHRPYKAIPEGGGNPVTVQMTPNDVSNVYRGLSDHHMLAITDSGNTTGAPNWERMIVENNQLVVPVMTSDDRDDGAVETLRVLNSYGGEFAEKARNAIVAVSVWHKGDEVVAKAAVKRWTPHARKVVVIPHDPRLVHGLEFSKLRPKTRLAFTQLAAAIAEALREGRS